MEDIAYTPMKNSIALETFSNPFSSNSNPLSGKLASGDGFRFDFGGRNKRISPSPNELSDWNSIKSKKHNKNINNMIQNGVNNPTTPTDQKNNNIGPSNLSISLKNQNTFSDENPEKQSGLNQMQNDKFSFANFVTSNKQKASLNIINEGDQNDSGDEK